MQVFCKYWHTVLRSTDDGSEREERGAVGTAKTL